MNRKSTLVAWLLLGLLCLPISSQAVDIYLKVEGSTQGLITAGANSTDSVGSLATSYDPDWSLVLGYGQSVYHPVDPQSGQPTTQTVHGGVTVVKYLDKASPLLVSALINAEPLTTVKLEFFRDGSVNPYYRIQLNNARVISITPTSSPAVNGNTVQRESVVFVYQTITFTHLGAGTGGGN